MNENSRVSISRRRYLQTATAATLLGGVSTATAQQSNGERQVVVEQDGKCIPMKPLSYQGLPVEAFYDYRTPDTDPSSYQYASFGTEALQRKNTSIMFLYDGPKGLSLVIVHDKVNNPSKGGAVTFRITGMPAKGKWIVKDDSYDGSTNRDTFDYSVHRDWNGKKSATSVINWTWQDRRADGGVYRGLGKEFKFTVNPAFNKKALLSDAEGSYSGKIDKWEVLSGNVNNPTRTKLNMNKSVTIKTGSCGGQTTTTTEKKKKSTTQETSEPKETPTTTTAKAAKESQQRGFFEKIWHGLASAVNAVVSFFRGLF